MINLVEKFREFNPGYTEEHLKQYQFWSSPEGRIQLESLLLTVFNTQRPNETEADALKRLGKMDMLIAIKGNIAQTDQLFNKLGELTRVEQQTN